jgi:dipeptidyl aminopeptidase/acylaminoacyl peptidase
MPSLLDLEQLVRIPSVSGYSLAPDGQTLAVVWDKSGQYEIYLVPLVPADQPRPITIGPESKMSPRFSPDGKRLIFTQDYGGDERFDIFVYDLATGQARNLTPNTPEIINPDVAWSPDGQRLAFISNREGKFATYTLSLENPGDIRRVTRHTYSDISAQWSPDGKYLAVTAQAKGQEAWTFIVPAEGGDAKPIGGPGGPVDAWSARWSPDGKQIAFVSDASGINGIYTYNLAAGALIRETALTHEATEPAWSPAGQQLAFAWNEDGNVRMGVKDLASGETRFFSVAPGVHAHPRFTPDGASLLALYNGPGHPNDVWLIPLAKGKPRQLTQSLPKNFTGREFTAPELARWQSDGLTISGFLYKPRNFKKGQSPALLYVHGGPTAQYQNMWLAAVQYLVSAGFVVLAPNYRGSSGSGKAFQEANRFDLGGGDMRDVIAGAEFLARAGYADSKRIAITGASYGGYLTMTALTKHPTVFAAGSALVPFLNWFTEYANEREDLKYWDQQNFGDPLRDGDRYRQYSPIFFMENIVAPVQMIAGANDPRCPADETRQAAKALKDMNVPHAVIIYPDEGHGFRKMSNRVHALRQRAEFLMTHLGLIKKPAVKKPVAKRPTMKKKTPLKGKTAVGKKKTARVKHK